jgi:hypothetical protein
MTGQLELTDRLRNIADSVQGQGIDLVMGLRDKIFQSLEFRPYNEETKEHEFSIRWARTADQIISDGYVYQEKGCTDIVVAYLGLAKARGFYTRFIKVFAKQSVHSIAEILFDNEWHNFDVASINSQPQKGQYTKGVPINGWYLWKKGQDAWDIGLRKPGDIAKIR